MKTKTTFERQNLTNIHKISQFEKRQFAQFQFKSPGENGEFNNEFKQIRLKFQIGEKNDI